MNATASESHIRELLGRSGVVADLSPAEVTELIGAIQEMAGQGLSPETAVDLIRRGREMATERVINGDPSAYQPLGLITIRSK